MENETKMSENKMQQVSLDTPVEPAILSRIETIQNARMQLGDRLLDLEQERVRVLRAASNLDAERVRIFEEINVARGLSPTTPVEIDAKTGKVTPLQTQGEPKTVEVPTEV
jgi:hypothetical protein